MGDCLVYFVLRSTAKNYRRGRWCAGKYSHARVLGHICSHLRRRAPLRQQLIERGVIILVLLVVGEVVARFFGEEHRATSILVLLMIIMNGMWYYGRY